MADTTTQLEAERWVVSEFLPRHFGGLCFSSRKLPPAWGGKFVFDAVSSDGRIVGLISTSSARTAGNNLATAKIQKLKCDTLYLLHTDGVHQRMLIFTDPSMLEHFEKEKRSGRFPSEIELLHAPLPDELHERILAS
ncbi:MAG: hypothetical protein L0Z46_12000 [Nitrospiraceae bacterium]|nr:hypothetical protein [Nitrospiraceae bacterium]